MEPEGMFVRIPYFLSYPSRDCSYSGACRDWTTSSSNSIASLRTETRGSIFVWLWDMFVFLCLLFNSSALHEQNTGEPIERVTTTFELGLAASFIQRSVNEQVLMLYGQLYLNCHYTRKLTPSFLQVSSLDESELWPPGRKMVVW